MEKVKIVIVGGGTAGITVASMLKKKFSPSDIVIIEPSERHAYQPLWTLVGGGVVSREETARPMKSVIPKGVKWIQEKVATFEPEENQVTLSDGKTIEYEFLVVAPGIQLDFENIKGVVGNLGKGNGLCSNYTWDTMNSTWEEIKNFKGGTAIFTFPTNPIKCAGAPQKIMWLAEESFRKAGIGDKTKIIYVAPGGAMFGIERYKIPLNAMAKERGIETMFGHHLTAVDADNKKATLTEVATGKETIIDYDMMHITPPMSAPDFIKHSSISTAKSLDVEELKTLCYEITPSSEALGYVEVDKFSTQHVTYKNIFSIGDASSLPCSKTGAAIRKQAPVMAENLYLVSQGKAPTAKYNGYASCPLVTDRSHVMLAEFGYDGVIMESFPFAQNKPRRSMWFLKRHALPSLYWNMMLKGKV